VQDAVATSGRCFSPGRGTTVNFTLEVELAGKRDPVRLYLKEWFKHHGTGLNEATFITGLPSNGGLKWTAGAFLDPIIIAKMINEGLGYYNNTEPRFVTDKWKLDCMRDLDELFTALAMSALRQKFKLGPGRRLA
jgi:hypothetical protein